MADNSREARGLVSPIAPALTSASHAVNMSRCNAEALRAACDLADAVADEAFHRNRADFIRDAIAKTGRAPKRENLPDRENASVIISGAGRTDDVCINADYLRDALTGLPRHAKPEFKCGGTLDPVVIRREDGGIAVIMPMRVDVDDRDTWPKIGEVVS